MENSENISEQEQLRLSLANYLKETDPLNIGVYNLEPLPAAEYHQNFKFEADDKAYVARMSVMQLSRKTDQIQQEYGYLDYLSKFGIAPKVFHLDMEGHDYPLLIEEFIEGPVFTEPTDENLDKFADVLSDLYATPLEEGHPFEQKEPSYLADFDKYRSVYDEYEGAEVISHWSDRVESSSTTLREVLASLEPLVQSVEPKLVRRDANPRNLIDQNGKFVWIDWEAAEINDPTITVASFVNETELYDWFEPKLQPEQRERVVSQFIEQTGLENGEKLIQARLLIERYWGMIWAIERIFKHKNGELPEHLSTPDRLERYEFIATASYDALQTDLAKISELQDGM